jgi:outer membrane protein OmpA-like peptidoglycan-associated protein
MSVKGMTGLSANAKNETESPGKHSTYSKALEVKKGERYYLVVDNYSNANSPFTLILHFRFTNEMEDTVAKKIIKPVAAVKGPFQINVIDSVSGASVKAKIRITWINPDNKPKIEITAKTYPLPLKKGEKINIVCYTKGYLIVQKTYIAQTDSDKGIDMKLLQIREHMKMTFKHIQFVADKPEFLPSAMESLNDLFEFMNSNPDVKILIKGYVNDPHGTNQSTFDLDLSKRRAEAVYNYLVDNNIAKSRVQWMGCSNKDMIYADPVNLDEMEANRRVEVEIIK